MTLDLQGIADSLALVRSGDLTHYSHDPTVVAVAIRPEAGHLLFVPDGRVARDRDGHPLLFGTAGDAWDYLDDRAEELRALGLPDADEWLVVPFGTENVGAAAVDSRRGRVAHVEARARREQQAGEAEARRQREEDRRIVATADDASEAYRAAGGGEAGVDAAHEVLAASPDPYRSVRMALDLIFDPEKGRGVSPLSKTQYGHSGWHWMEYLTDAQRRFGAPS